MDADYSVELGPTAPALEIPWKDPEGHLQYLDLRNHPAAIENLPEAQQHPAMRRFLQEVNSPHSAWQTAKCDVWSEAADSAENLYAGSFVHGCYVDLVLAVQGPVVRHSLDLHQQLARQLAQSLEAPEANAALEATAEIVVRRCYFHREVAAHEPEDESPEDELLGIESDAGYCLTLFLSGFGISAEAAANCWEQALQLAAGCLLQLRLQEERAKARELS